MSYVKRPEEAKPRDVPGQAVKACPFFERFPAIWEYVSSNQYDDGGARQRASLTVFYEDGTLKICLSDRETERTAWASSDGLEDALAGLERSIADGSVQWRKKQQGYAQSRSKRG